MSISFDPGKATSDVHAQMQVNIMRQSQDLFKENTLQLINSVAKVNEAAKPSQDNNPNVGRNINTVA